MSFSLATLQNNSRRTKRQTWKTRKKILRIKILWMLENGKRKCRRRFKFNLCWFSAAVRLSNLNFFSYSLSHFFPCWFMLKWWTWNSQSCDMQSRFCRLSTELGSGTTDENLVIKYFQFTWGFCSHVGMWYVHMLRWCFLFWIILLHSF